MHQRSSPNLRASISCCTETDGLTWQEIVKAWGEDWGRNCPVFTTFTPIMCSWYMEDFLMPAFYQGFGGFPWETDDEGYRTLRSPLLGGEEHVPWISVRDDFGDLVHGIFLNPLRWHLRTVQAVGEIRSFAGVVDVFQRGRSLPGHRVETVLTVTQ